MLTVHHLGISQSDRIVWLCEELEIPYQIKRYQRDPVTRMAPADYKALHPCGTAPVIEDGTLMLAESGAIIEYMIARHGGGRLAVPVDSANFPDYLFWLHFANASLMSAALGCFIVQAIPQRSDTAPVNFVVARLDLAYRMIEQRLAVADYFAGPLFSAADIIMLFPLTTMRAFVPRDLTPYPNIRAYLRRIGARPAFQRAMAKADPDFTPLLE